MLSIASLLSKLSVDFPDFVFVASDDFHWSAEERTIYYDAASSDVAALLHEIAHATLMHQTYLKDVRLLEMERDAWEHARRTLAPTYGVTIDNDTVQDALDTYRDWLHSRSTCPHCKAAGLQGKKNTYRCVACGGRWRVNDARTCALRRYKVPPHIKTPS